MSFDHLGSVPHDDDGDGVPDSLEYYEDWDEYKWKEYYEKRSLLEKVEDFFEDAAFELEHLFKDAYDETSYYFEGMIDLYKNW